jgi:hypothetical protein
MSMHLTFYREAYDIAPCAHCVARAELLDSIRCSFEISLSALVQASVNLGVLGMAHTRLEVQAVVEDLRKAIATIDAHKSNTVEMLNKAKEQM